MNSSVLLNSFISPLPTVSKGRVFVTKPASFSIGRTLSVAEKISF